jgi:hypothetical protein
MELDIRCSLAGGDVPCHISCMHVDSEDESDYNMSCTITIPYIDYVSSPYFIPGSREIRFSGNFINVTMIYNDGFLQAVKFFDYNLGGAVIDVTSHCGEGSGEPFQMCEAWLGEDETNCCRDCGCSSFGDDYFCYMGTSGNGQCIENSSIGLEIKGISPEPMECIIGRIGGDCIFVKTHILNLKVKNSPSDAVIIEAFYSINNGNNTVMECGPGAGLGNWSCPIAPPPIENRTEGLAKGSIEVFLGIGYSIGEARIVGSVSDSYNYRVMKNKSNALISCEKEIERLEEQLARLRQNQDDYNSHGSMYLIMGAIMVAAGTALIIAGKICLNSKPDDKTPCIIMITTGIGMVLTGLTQILLGNKGQDKSMEIQTQIDQMEAVLSAKREMCASETLEGLAQAETVLAPLSYFNPY